MNVTPIIKNTKLETISNIHLPQRKQAETQTVASHFATVPNLMYGRHLINFTGNASSITKALSLGPDGHETELKPTKNGGFIVEERTNTELIYGNNAKKYLENKTTFDKDTHVIFPKKAKGKVTIDGKTTKIDENTAIVINKGAEAKIEVSKGYPMVMTSGNSLNWYSKYSNRSDEDLIKSKYAELRAINAHLYNGEIKREKLDENIVSKLIETNFVKEKEDNYIKFNHYFVPEFMAKELAKNGFSEDEINSLMPIYKGIRDAKIESKISKKGLRHDMSDEVIQKLKDAKILHKSNIKNDEVVYWTRNYKNSAELKSRLKDIEFSDDDLNTVVTAWRKDNKTGYDLTGLKFLSDNISMYSFDQKLNNWSLEPSCWITNSTAMSTKDGKTMNMGTSIVQSDIETPVDMRKLHSSEKLHKHPAREDKAQSEIYLVTSGCAALNILKDGKPTVKLIKQGEVVVINPGVVHCVNSVIGEYEQLVSQIPSAFQYGFGFKEEVDENGYDMNALTQEATSELLEAKKEIDKDSKVA